jgi:hypothetical protein
MKKSAAICIPLALVLTGCDDSSIDTVKNSILEIDTSYTVEQAFDNRKSCNSTSWNTFEDARGRQLVEYKCQLKGIVSHLEEQETQFNNMIKEVTDKKRSKLEKRIAESKESVEYYNNPNNLDSNNNAKYHAKKLAESEEAIRYMDAKVIEWIDNKDNALKVDDVYEVYQWGFESETLPVIIYGGLQIVYKNGNELDLPHSTLSNSVNNIYQDKANDLKSFLIDENLDLIKIYKESNS